MAFPKAIKAFDQSCSTREKQSKIPDYCVLQVKAFKRDLPISVYHLNPRANLGVIEVVQCRYYYKA